MSREANAKLLRNLNIVVEAGRPDGVTRVNQAQLNEVLQGALVPAKDLPRPFGMDYDPTRYTTNYFKSFIKRKARWQMGGQHGISVRAYIIKKRVGCGYTRRSTEGLRYRRCICGHFKAL